MTKKIFFGNSPEYFVWEELTEAIQPWEDGLRAPTNRGTFEWWYFDAHLDDQATDPLARGSTVVVVFATKPLLERAGPLKPGVSITITRPDGSKITDFPLFSADDFSASKETCDVRIADNWVNGDLNHYELHARVKGVQADLTFTGIVPAWRPGVGKIYFGNLEHSFGWLPSIPYGRVEGTLTFDGQTHQVSGSGYHDHNWGNVGMDQVMDHWYWGRAHIGEYTLIYAEMVGAQAYGYAKMPVFMLAKGDQILTGNGLTLKLHTSNFEPHPGGRAYPQEVDFNWQDGSDSIRINLRQPKLIEAVSMLETFAAWKRRLFRLFANPYYFRFNAQMEISINLNWVQASLHGPALYEIMILQGKKHP